MKGIRKLLFLFLVVFIFFIAYAGFESIYWTFLREEIKNFYSVHEFFILIFALVFLQESFYGVLSFYFGVKRT